MITALMERVGEAFGFVRCVGGTCCKCCRALILILVTPSSTLVLVLIC
jgi:hypothetical protein